jgi:hypothetical protein
MRAFLFIVVVASSIAHADSTLYTPLVDMRTVDPPCRTRAEVPSHARISGPSFDAAVSTANCMAMTRATQLELAPTEASVKALDAAVAPAMAILDAVIATGDPAHQLIAQHSELDILQSNTARMFVAVPQPSPQMASSELADQAIVLAATDALTEPWRRRALQCRRQIARLVYQHPELATRDAVFAHMVADSRIIDAAGVAGR